MGPCQDTDESVIRLHMLLDLVSKPHSATLEPPGLRTSIGWRAAVIISSEACSWWPQASLAKEAQGTGVTVHLASPGMVATDLLARSVAHNPRAAWVLNILAEEPRTVARWLAPRMRVCMDFVM